MEMAHASQNQQHIWELNGKINNEFQDIIVLCQIKFTVKRINTTNEKNSKISISQDIIQLITCDFDTMKHIVTAV